MTDTRTLSNVKTHGEGISPGVGFTSETIPEAKSSQTGVSVRYVPDNYKSWYVFRASYGREDKASDYLVEDGTYVYIAKRMVRKQEGGKQKTVFESLIPNILFAYTTSVKADEYVKNTPSLFFLSYYLNHFVLNEHKKNPPLTIPCHEMENFICATSNRNEHLMSVRLSQCHFKKGELVKVIEGSFQGVIGKVARVSGQQRVIITIENLCSIATAYIPTAFLEKMIQ